MASRGTRRWRWAGSWLDRPILALAGAVLLLVGCLGATSEAALAWSDGRLLHSALARDSWCPAADSSSCVRRVAVTLEPSHDQRRDTADLWVATTTDGARIPAFTVGNAHDDTLRPWVGTEVFALVHDDRVLGVETGSGEVVEVQAVGNRGFWTAVFLALICLLLALAAATWGLVQRRVRASWWARTGSAPSGLPVITSTALKLTVVTVAGWLALALDLPTLLALVGLALAGLVWLVVAVMNRRGPAPQ